MESITILSEEETGQSDYPIRVQFIYDKDKKGIVYQEAEQLDNRKPARWFWINGGIVLYDLVEQLEKARVLHKITKEQNTREKRLQEIEALRCFAEFSQLLKKDGPMKVEL